MLGSVLAGLAQGTGELIACRVLQGLGAGGLTALAQVIMATMIAPASGAATAATSAP